MKTKYFLIKLSFLLFIFSQLLFECTNEPKEDEIEIESYSHDDKEDLVVIHKKIPGQPDVLINVAKRYDDKGNLVSFDSTYSSYYAGSGLDTLLMDSLILQFHPYYFEHYTPLFKNRMDRLFFGDSMLYSDFFHDDFFQRRYSLNVAYFNQMMFEMDSIKNDFYKRKSEYLKK